MTVFVDDKVAQAFRVGDTERCVCGGFRVVVHCPKCGSTQCYGNRRASPEALLPGDSLPTRVRAFRCKLCSHLFSEVDSVNACKAKTRWRQQAEMNERVSASVSKLPDKSQQALLEEFYKIHPERRPKAPASETQERSPLDIADEERRRNREQSNDGD
jgi:hypothetical protein